MKNFVFIYPAFLFILFSVVTVPCKITFAAQQEKLRLNHADNFVNYFDKGKERRRFSGNVSLSQGMMNLRCDTVYILVELGKYECIGNVIVADGDKSLTAKKMEYYDDRKLLVVPVPFRMTQENRTLTALYGEYYRDKSIVYARRAVRLKEVDREIFCDDLTYDQNKKSGKALGHVRIYDHRENIKINGPAADFFDEEKYIYMPNNPVAWLIDEAAGDTAIIKSEIFEVRGDSSLYLAKGKVHFTKGGLNATCGRMIYNKADSLIELITDPKAWQENNTLFGDNMRMHLDGRKITLLDVTGNARAVSPADSTGSHNEENILKGKQIIMDIENNILKHMTATKNAESIFYSFDNGKSQGANYASGEKIKIKFSEGRFSNLFVIHGIKGVFYPPKLIHLAKMESTSNKAPAGNRKKNESSEGRKPPKEIREKGRRR